MTSNDAFMVTFQQFEHEQQGSDDRQSQKHIPAFTSGTILIFFEVLTLSQDGELISFRVLTLSETCKMVSWGKQPRAMLCLMMEKAALIMAWLATQAAAVANTNTNCKHTHMHSGP